ncbi:hypothetical protein [Aestuariivivens sp. NBU2969]|uniref:hypothetical protein n=1 Tax=Aestuariivivens sp. NBU2969 TaxID=2873267 RepID=UPI001CBCC20A|nr:hypothetical protein [Aestuariivivens sp. NBU2969]
MKKILSVLILLILPISSFSQIKDSIALPEGGKEVSFYATTNIYVTKNQNVSTDNKTFRYFDDISNSIINQFDYSNPPRVLLYADKNTRFEFIERIKKEIALVDKKLYLMTDNIGNSSKGIPIYLNSLLGVHKNSSHILTLEQVLRNEKLNATKYKYTPPPKPLPNVWYHDFENIIYSGNKKNIDSILEKKSYSSIRLKPEKNIAYNGKNIDLDLLKEIFTKNDIVFLKFDYHLIYDDYVFIINQYSELKKLNKEAAYLIEIPYDLEYLLKDKQIKI